MGLDRFLYGRLCALNGIKTRLLIIVFALVLFLDVKGLSSVMLVTVSTVAALIGGLCILVHKLPTFCICFLCSDFVRLCLPSAS
jgi:hypothetical protein